MKTDQLVIAVEIRGGHERRPENLRHLRVDGDQAPGGYLGDDYSNGHLLLNCMGEGSLCDETQLGVVRRSLGDAALYLGTDRCGQRSPRIAVNRRPAPWLNVPPTQST